MSVSTDVRNEVFLYLQSRLQKDRRRVYDAYMMWGPGTTREMAGRMGMDLLTVRPRATELLQDGLLETIGRDGHDGIYAAVRLLDAMRRAEEASRPQQMEMELKG